MLARFAVANADASAAHCINVRMWGCTRHAHSVSHVLALFHSSLPSLHEPRCLARQACLRRDATKGSQSKLAVARVQLAEHSGRTCATLDEVLPQITRLALSARETSANDPKGGSRQDAQVRAIIGGLSEVRHGCHAAETRLLL